MKTKLLFATAVAFMLAASPAVAQEKKSKIVEDGGTGQYKAVMMSEPTLATHTIFRPQDLKPFGKDKLLPIVIWGNGGCANSPSGHINFLNEVASQGFLIVAIGVSDFERAEAPRPGQTGDMPRMPQMGGGMPQMGGGMPQMGGGMPQMGGEMPQMGGGMPQMGGGMPQMGGGMPQMGGGMPQMGGGMPQMGGMMSMGDPADLKKALEWAISQNADKKSPYYQKLDVENIAAAGMSCGGLQALHMSDDARVKTILVMNSGYFNGGEDKASLNTMKAKSVIWILGGPTDIAYNNGMDDFKQIEGKPAFVCNLDGVGHGGTYMRPNGGEYAIVATAWLKWQLQNNTEAGNMFTGEKCGLSQREGWTVDKKNIK